MDLQKILIFMLVTSVVEVLTIEPPICGSTNIPCVCHDKYKDKFIHLKSRMIAEQDIGSGRFRCVEKHDPKEACARMNCVLNKEKYDMDDLEYFEYTINGRTLSSGYSGRERRSSSVHCQMPDQKHATFSCHRFPKARVCKMTCIYGYAVRDMFKDISLKSKDMYCLEYENIWRSPQGLEECRPYMNCTIVLVDAGTLKCNQPVNSGPVCEISCWDWTRNTSSSYSKHVCKDGVVSPPLPSCASQKSENLIKPPGHGTKTTKKPADYKGYKNFRTEFSGMTSRTYGIHIPNA